MSTTGHRGARIAFVVVGGPLAVVLILVFAVSVTGTLARQTESTPLTFAEDIVRVRIDLTQGSITLRGSDRSGVAGERVLTRGIQEPSYSERIEGGTLVIESSCLPIGNTWCDVSYVLDIPDSIEIEASTAVGAIRMSDVDGSAHLQSATGSVTVENASGTLRLQSAAGSVDGRGLSAQAVQAESGAGSVVLAFAAAPRNVDARAGAGSVDIEVPQDESRYRILDLPDGNQDRRIAVATDPDSTNVLRLESGAGSVSVHYPEA